MSKRYSTDLTDRQWEIIEPLIPPDKEGGRPVLLKGYHSPENQKILSELLELIVLPKKGKLSALDQEREGSQDFKNLRSSHSGVEPAINALEVHGLDFCPDRGIDNFKKYVALAVVARNLQLIGAILKKNEKKREERSNKKHLKQKHAA